MAPSMVAGAVEPIVGIAMKLNGIPASAYVRAHSKPCASCASGEMVQMLAQIGGRGGRGAGGPGPPAHHRRHLDDVLRELRVHGRPAAHVLAGVGESGVALVQRRRAPVVLGADRRPEEGQQRQRVADARHELDVVLARSAHFARDRVRDLRPHALGADVAAAPVEEQVEPLLTPREHERARRGRHGLDDEIGRDADDLVVTHPGAVPGEDLASPGRRHVHADLIEDRQGALAQALDLCRVERALTGPRRDAGDVGRLAAHRVSSSAGRRTGSYTKAWSLRKGQSPPRSRRS
jgi:hypothetical protein